MKSRIKILHFITNSCNHPYLYTVTDYADKTRFDISAASLNPAGDLQNHYEKQGIQTFSLDSLKRSQYPRAVLKLACWLRRNQIDIIQTHLYDASLVGLAAAKIARTPLAIFTGHHSHEMPFYKGKLSFLGDCLSSRYLSNYIIAPSEQMKEIFVESENVPVDKIAVVHHGFDFTSWKPSERARRRVRKEFDLDGKIVFGAIGKFFWIKDYPTLFKAFASVAAKFPDVRLMIVGTGDRTDLRQLAENLAIGEQIIFTGWRADIPDLFSAMDIFVHSSLAESFGMVIIEAMAMGKPVICTDVGIAREIIKDNVNGFLVPPKNPEMFGAALEKMLRRRARWSEMGQAGRNRAQDFTAEKMVAGYEEYYVKWLKNIKNW